MRVASNITVDPLAEDMDENVAKLLEMGFEIDGIREILTQKNNFDYALSVLLNQKNQEKKKDEKQALKFAESRESLKSLDAMEKGAKVAPSFNTFTCLVDINSPNIYFYPRNFYVVPLIKLQLPKIMVVAHQELPVPSLIEDGTPVCPVNEDRIPNFPEEESDYVCRKFDQGFGRQVNSFSFLSTFRSSYLPFTSSIFFFPP